ncbi:hypothetical protein [Kitasatospora sp. McL0602]|uniref:hypothetical protein n=1 Tax=Kitasatospora sp. McL0602 TaxID=3439530 RepID=UPI003F8923F9
MTSLDRTARDISPGEPSPAARHRVDAETATAANLLSGLAARLRAAYERGADINGLALASRQSAADVRELLRSAGAVVPADDQELPAAPALEQLRRARRPTPSRRLSRLHPRIEADGAAPAKKSQAQTLTPVEPATASTPLGILIGASPAYTEPAVQPEGRGPRRVPARVLRTGRGTSLVVLPSWRASIAVSVPTDLLLRETGLRQEQLGDARLTVRMNPEALHDRELDLAEWRSEALGRRARNDL